MGSIQIFALEFSGTRFACSRDFAGSYRLQAGDFVVTMTPDGASALAEGGASIRTKAKVAAHFRREMKAGATYRRDLLAVDGRVVHIELGVSDAGDSIFLEVGTGRMTLTDGQAQILLFSLDRLGGDVNALYRASSGGPQELTIVQGLRGWLYDWETGAKW
jgi:hypothetical protein